MERTFKNSLFKMLSDSRISLNPTPVKLPSGTYLVISTRLGEGVGSESASCSEQWSKGPRESQSHAPSELWVKNTNKKEAGMS